MIRHTGDALGDDTRSLFRNASKGFLQIDMHISVFMHVILQSALPLILGICLHQ